MSGIFKAYDIRGVYKEQLDEEVAYKIGRAYATFMQEEKGKAELKIVVGRDMRLSSPALKQALVKGLTEQGVDVVDIGLVSTPTFYFGVASEGYDGGVQVSASHNPAQWNGFKMVKELAIPIGQGYGMEEIEEVFHKNKFKDYKQGKVYNRSDILDKQIEHDFKYTDISIIKPLKVVADPANSMGATYLSKMFERLPCQLIKLNFELDGSFPGHEPDPLKDENNRQLQQKVLEVEADVGIATDGDGDRIFFIDDKGETVPPYILRGLLAEIFLRKHKGATICYDIRPGKITVDMIKAGGGKPVVTRVGHSLIKAKMREVNAIFGGESSGHFFLKLEKGVYEVPVIVALKILEEISKANKKFSELIAPYKKYYHSGEINFSVSDKAAAIKRIEERFKNEAKEISYLDGITVELEEYWFNVRPSNTEPKLRLNLEAVSKEAMEKGVEEVSKIIMAE